MRFMSLWYYTDQPVILYMFAVQEHISGIRSKGNDEPAL